MSVARDRRYSAGALVAWAPATASERSAIPLEPGHPGVVGGLSDPEAVFVDWVDRSGPLALDGAYDQDSLTPLTEEEFTARATEVRAGRYEREGRGTAAGRTYAERTDDPTA